MPHIRLRRTGFARVASAMAFFLPAASDRPASALDFYEGKTLAIIVGNDAGSGYDSYARVLSRHMAKYIPGKPNIVVQNMPGAGSINAAQNVFFVAPKDGTTIAILFPGAIIEPLTGDPAKYRYDPTKFEFLGTADSGTRLCFTNANANVKTFADARARKSLMAATAAGSSAWDYAYFFNALAGTKFEVVSGYKGPAEMFLAMERGEADGVCALDSGALGAVRPEWFAPGKLNFLAQAGLEPNERFTKMGAPSMWDFIPPENRATAELIVSQQVFGRPFVAPPGTAEPQMKILRAAFAQAWKDPDALEDAARMKIDVNPRDGDVVAGLVRKIYESPRALIERMAKAIRP